MIESDLKGTGATGRRQMSIIGFHRVLIGTAILFCGLFGAWEGVSFARGGTWVELLLAVAFGAAALALLYYLIHLNRFLNRETPS